MRKALSQKPISLTVVRSRNFARMNGPDLRPKTKEGWIAFLQTTSDTEIIWLAPWMPYVSLLYRCGDKPWVQLPGLWGAVSYAPLMMVRQLGGRQFIPALQD